MLFINAQLLTMDGPDIPEGFLLIKGDKIAALGPMTACPDQYGGEMIDLQGKLLLPGFIDAHSHLGLFGDSLGVEGDDGNEDTDPITPHLRALDAINPFDRCFAEAAQSGVTTSVVSPGSANPIGGQICAIKNHGRWIDRMVVREPLAIKFAFGENPKMCYGHKNQAPVTRMATAALIREQLSKAKRYMEDCEAAAEDDELEEPEYDAKCEALVPLLSGQIRAHIHAHQAYDILSGIRIAKEFGFSFSLIHCTEGHMIADVLAEMGADVICGPLMGTRSKPELGNMVPDNCAKLAQAGIPIAISTDHPEVPANYLVMSAVIAATHGLDQRKTLEAITCNAAKAADLFDRIGSLTPGKDADLVVLEGGLPLSVETKPAMVFIDGCRIV
ncbi:amidohydrolase [Oscillospiraceae bacterium MB08-C2-2]|nr:amidohydrolase [Oscillospiraceae bacterium MB08-C2-2]